MICEWVSVNNGQVRACAADAVVKLETLQDHVTGHYCVRHAVREILDAQEEMREK